MNTVNLRRLIEYLENVPEEEFDIVDSEKCVMGHCETAFGEEILALPIDGKYYTTQCRRWLDLEEHGEMSCIWRDLVTACREQIPTRYAAVSKLHLIYDLATEKGPES